MSEYLPLDERVKRLELARDELTRQLEELKTEGITTIASCPEHAGPEMDMALVPLMKLVAIEGRLEAVEEAELLREHYKPGEATKHPTRAAFIVDYEWCCKIQAAMEDLKNRVEAIERRVMAEKFAKPKLALSEEAQRELSKQYAPAAQEQKPWLYWGDKRFYAVLANYAIEYLDNSYYPIRLYETEIEAQADRSRLQDPESYRIVKLFVTNK